MKKKWALEDLSLTNHCSGKKEPQEGAVFPYPKEMYLRQIWMMSIKAADPVFPT